MPQTGKERRGRPSRVPATVLAVRRFIAGRRLQPHDQLPSEPDLAAELGVSCMTLRKGLEQLAGEGLLERRHGVGTFLRHRPTRTLGFSFKERVFYLPTSDFYRGLFQETQAWAAAHGMSAGFVPRDDEGRLTPTAVDMLQRRQVDGLLVVTTQNWQDIDERLRPFGVPAVHAFAREGDGITSYSMAHSANIAPAVAALAELGHTQVGLLGRQMAVRQADHDEAVAAIAAHGMRTEPHWLFPGRVPRQDPVDNGRRVARQWLAAPDRPPALVAVDPFEVQGFLYELLGPDSDTPAMPVIAVTEAEESILDLPWPVIRVRYAARRPLVAALEMLECLMAGGEPAVPHVVIESPTRVFVPANLRQALAAS